MDSSSDQLEPVELLADEFMERKRRGENPTIQEYVDRYPEHAEEIREVFPALAVIERVAPVSADLAQSFPTGQSGAKRLEQVGDFRILREIGRGGMGVVYEAEQQSLRRRVALKVIPKTQGGDAKSLERFQREARAAARMHHTNIVPVFEVGSDDQHVFYAMQLIQGQSLDNVVHDLKTLRTEIGDNAQVDGNGRAPGEAQSIAASLVLGKFDAQGLGEDEQADATGFQPRQLSSREAETVDRRIDAQNSSARLPGESEISTAVSNRDKYFRSVAMIGLQTAEAIAYAHARGIIHRDIKPSNLLLDTAGTVWITDFGLAKTNDEAMTHTGDLLGTLRYMSPERFRGRCDVRADIYSLGLTLYELAVLKPAFDSPDRLRLIDMVNQTEPVTPRSVDSRIPRDLETIILKSSDKDSKRRYQSADEMADDLQRFVNDEPIKARRATMLERYARWSRRNRGLAAATILIATLLVAGMIGSSAAAIYFQQKKEEQRILAEKNRTLAEEKARLADEAERQRETAQLARQAEAKIAAQAKADQRIAQRNNYRSTIKLAESMLQGDTKSKSHVADILWGADPDLRGWEWGYLMARCPLEQWNFQTSQGGVDKLAASADGRFLATAGVDGTVVLWDSWTCNEVWRQETGRVQALAIDSVGRYIGIGSAKESQPCFQILDLASGRRLHESSEKGPSLVAFGSIGSEFYVFKTQKRLLERFSTDKWQQLCSVKAGSPFTNFLFVDMAGAYVGLAEFANDRKQYDLFDAQTLHSVAVFDSILPIGAGLFNFSRPCLNSALGRIVYSQGSNVLGDALLDQTGKPGAARDLFSLPKNVAHLEYDPRSETIIAASNDGTVVHFDSRGDMQTYWHGAAIRDLALLSDGRFVTAGADGLLKCWKLAGPNVLAANTSVATEDKSARNLAFVGDKLFYQNHNKANHFLYELSPPSQRQFVRPQPGEYHFSFPLIRPHTNELVVDNLSGITLYGLGNEGLTSAKPRSIAIAEPKHVAFDASGRFMVASTERGTVDVFDLDSDRKLPVPKTVGSGTVAINPAGTRAALLTETSLQVWDVSTGRMRKGFDFSPGNGPGMDDGFSYPTTAVFHPDGELIAFIESSPNSMCIVLWDTTLGQRRASIPIDAGIEAFSCVFSTDGSRILAACNDAKVRIWDWRLGKELLALSNISAVYRAVANQDGVTIAYAGYAPNLRVAKALPYSKTIQRDNDFVHAIDELQIYSAQLEPKTEASQAELLGDICLRRSEAAQASAHYDRAIEIRQRAVLTSPDDIELQRPLASLYEKRFVAAEANQLHGGTVVLRQATEFWQKVLAQVPSRTRNLAVILGAQRPEVVLPLEQHLVLAQLKLLDRLLAHADKDGLELLQTLLQSSVTRAAQEPENRFLQNSLRALLSRVVQVSLMRRNHPSIDRLVSADPALATTFGDLIADENHWAMVVAAFSKGITEETTNAELLGVRAHALEQLQNWDAAAEDWARAASGHPEGVNWLAEFTRRRAAGGKGRLSESARQEVRSHLEQQLLQNPDNAAWAEALANLLLESSPSQWTTLWLTEFRAAGGATLTQQDDGSILASGTNADSEVYTLVGKPGLDRISAVRLDALVDPSLRYEGPGRAERGNFILNELRLFSGDQPYSMTGVCVKRGGDPKDLAMMIDGEIGNGMGWNNTPRFGESNTAIVGTGIQRQPGDELRIELHFCKSIFPKHNLGRFRLSVCDDPAAFNREQKRFEAMKFTDAWAKLAAAYYVHGEQAAFDKLIEQHPSAGAVIDDLVSGGSRSGVGQR